MLEEIEVKEIPLRLLNGRAAHQGYYYQYGGLNLESINFSRNFLNLCLTDSMFWKETEGVDLLILVKQIVKL